MKIYPINWSKRKKYKEFNNAFLNHKGSSPSFFEFLIYFCLVSGFLTFTVLGLNNLGSYVFFFTVFLSIFVFLYVNRKIKKTLNEVYVDEDKSSFSDKEDFTTEGLTSSITTKSFSALNILE